MFAVGIGKKISTSQLRAIASKPSNVIIVKDYSNLKDYIGKIVQKLCPSEPCDVLRIITIIFILINVFAIEGIIIFLRIKFIHYPIFELGKPFQFIISAVIH